MDELSTGIQDPGGSAGEKGAERPEIEIFDFVNQKPDLTTMEKGLFAESGAGTLPKKNQTSVGFGPRYENAWEEIELRDVERRAEQRRRAESGKSRVPGKRTAEHGRRRASGKRRTKREDRMRRVRAARIRIALIAALVLICILAGIFFARRKNTEKAIPVTVRRETAALAALPGEYCGSICCGDLYPVRVFD